MSGRLNHPGKSQPVWSLNLGLVDYAQALSLQQDIVKARIEKRLPQDVFLFLEHDPVFTLGRRGGLDNLMVSKAFLKQSGVNIVQVERGGDITYHGPGQLVIYPILNLDRRRLGITELVYLLEELMIRVSSSLGVPAERNPKNRGVWVGNHKLGSIGIAIRKGFSFHGMALNVNLDLEPFDWINPCGLTDTVMTSLKKERFKDTDMTTVMDMAHDHLEHLLGHKIQETTLDKLAEYI